MTLHKTNEINESDPLRVMSRAAARLRLNNLPDAVLQCARQRVLDTIGCLVAGYETEIRFGRAIHPHAFYKGWSTIGLLGAIGPAVTAAHLLGADETRMANTIGTVMSLLPAFTGRVSQGGSVKWLVGGHACTTGLFAADMAVREAKDNPEALNIWLPVIAEKNHPERLRDPQV